MEELEGKKKSVNCTFEHRNDQIQDFPGSLMVKNPPFKTGDASLIPGWGTKIPHTAQQLSLRIQLLSPRALEPMYCNKGTLEKACMLGKDLVKAK